MPVNFTSSKAVFLRRLKTLHMVNCGLTNLDVSSWNFPSLESLIVSHNQLIAIPVGLGKFRSLTNLNIDYNEIECFDFSQFKGLDNLEHLSVGHNKVQELIAGDSTLLASLISLKLNFNRLEDLEALPLQDLPALESLDLSGNNLPWCQTYDLFLGTGKRFALYANPFNCSDEIE
ncbi:fibromodulin-like [Uranotaenia lowii]|uniref:fibromodulin-like n=1 Tax=Uranotaenia lowii TaxID=190385 RepID=UPI002479C116|nr:fibromodulin-like [Uranotaenia lowii]